MTSDPINYPPRSTMLTLVGFVVGQTTEIIEGRLVMRFKCDESVMVLVTDENLTELERRGWITTNEDETGVEPTNTGVYWARRWADKHLAKVQQGKPGLKLTASTVHRISSLRG